MNIALWIAAGALLGWLGFRFMDKNGARGPIIAAIIGALGGFLGGSTLAPLFGHIELDPSAFRPFALVLACVTATACLAVSDMIYERYGV